MTTTARRTFRQVAAVTVVGAALALSATAAPDADAATTTSGGDARTGERAWAVSLPLTPWLPACEYEDSSDCVGGGGDWTARRVAAGAVCVEFTAAQGDNYCTADAYPPAHSPEWVQLSQSTARDLSDVFGGPVDSWAACAVTVTGTPQLACPNGALPYDDTRA